jgi:hypothetical protein
MSTIPSATTYDRAPTFLICTNLDCETSEPGWGEEHLGVKGRPGFRGLNCCYKCGQPLKRVTMEPRR